MGRLMGFEPMHIGTTIRGLNRLTTGAIIPTVLSIPNQDYKARGAELFVLAPCNFNLFSETYNRFRALLESIPD